MNIHFKDSTLFENLIKASLVKVEIGSTMYGTNDSGSDTDYLYVYATSQNELNSFLKSHHQLQFKENNIDHNFISLHGFLNNLINGDSTINFEVVNSDKLVNTPLQFLYDMRTAFNNYSIIRSYLGLARRDGKHYFKAPTHREQLKSITHIWRGFYYARAILNNNFKLIDVEFLEKVKEIRKTAEDDFKTKKELLNSSLDNISRLRDVLNEKFNNKKLNLPKYMDISKKKKLDSNLSNLMSMSSAWFYRQNHLNNFDLTPFYDSFENWVNYE